MPVTMGLHAHVEIMHTVIYVHFFPNNSQFIAIVNKPQTNIFYGYKSVWYEHEFILLAGGSLVSLKI